MIRIACVGDSLTRGDAAHEPGFHPKLSDRGNYPAVLQKLLGAHVKVLNFGHGGATACNTSDIPYEATREFRQAILFRPHVVVLMLGTNDAKQRHWHGRCGAKALQSGLQRIASSFRPASVGNQSTLLLIRPPPIVRERWDIRHANLRPVAKAITRFSQSQWHHQRCALGSTRLSPELPFWHDKAGPHSSSFVKDGVHLSIQGSRRLAHAVHQALKRMGCVVHQHASRK